MNFNNSIDSIKMKFMKKFHPEKYNDTYLRPLNKIHNGLLPLEKKAAIYLIFPKSGVLKSHLLALRYMIENGYSPIVVSNQPLGSSDIEQLQAVSYRILERENFGYDFGGYREAILVFQDVVKNLDRLAIFNDSVWFPIHDRANWLADAEAADRDLVGALSHAAISREDLHKEFSKLAAVSKQTPPTPHRNFEVSNWLEDFTDRLNTYKLAPAPILAVRSYLRDVRLHVPKSSLHYCSFALLISGEILKDSKFFSFWESLKISDSFIMTIIHGEIGFSQWVINSGYSHCAILDNEKIKNRLDLLTFDELVKSINESCLVGIPRPFLEIYNSLLKNKNPGKFNRDELIIFFVCMLSFHNCAYSAAEYLMKHHDFMFLKKKMVNSSWHQRNSAVGMTQLMADPIKAEMLNFIEKTADYYLPSGKYGVKNRKVNTAGKAKMFGGLIRIPRLWD